jgi:hypothetical protein
MQGDHHVEMGLVRMAEVNVASGLVVNVESLSQEGF